jgi:hypothetical protein
MNDDTTREFAYLLKLCFAQRNCPYANKLVFTASGDDLVILGKGQTQDFSFIRVIEWLADLFECGQVKETRCLVV